MCTVYCTHVFGSLLSVGASTVYTCSMFSMLSKTMVFLSATIVHRFMRFTQMQCRKCCFDVYKLLLTARILEHLLW